ncbi:MAG: hypothetical protein II920_07795 [Clostridia bacterium]|nr:hypothetical protein [Clostridia bacterium]
MYAEQKFFVGVQDTGMGGLITNTALIEDMSDSATVHGILRGQTVGAMRGENLAWVITHWKLKVLKRVGFAGTIKIRTWGQKYNAAFANRDFIAYDDNDEIIAKATSTWMVINTVKNFPQRLTPELMEGFDAPEMGENFPDFRFTNESYTRLEAVSTTYFTVNRFMADYNRHVHNSAYLAIALEALPENLDDSSFDNVEITYKKEIKPSQRVRLDYCRDGDTHYVLIYSEDGNTLHTVIKLW